MGSHSGICCLQPENIQTSTNSLRPPCTQVIITELFLAADGKKRCLGTNCVILAYKNVLMYETKPALLHHRGIEILHVYVDVKPVTWVAGTLKVS